MSKVSFFSLIASFSVSTLFGAPLFLTTSSNSLLRIDSATPGIISSNLAITGLQTASQRRALRGGQF